MAEQQEIKKGSPPVAESAMDIGGTVIFPKETPKAGAGCAVFFKAGDNGSEVRVVQSSSALRLLCPERDVSVSIEEDGSVRVSTPHQVVVDPVQLPIAKAS